MGALKPTPRSRAGELGDLLRARRERLQPAEVGLPAGTRRRTPGLRREEVALLATVSVTYYTFLEQGRELRPSRQVLDSLARALRLTPAEHRHIHQLVYGEPAAVPQATEEATPALKALVERLDPHPTYVTGRRFDVLAANRAARLLWTDWSEIPRHDRNMVWWTFTNPTARQVFVEWEHEASALLARYRAAAARHPADPAFEELTARLQDASPEVREWWPRHEIAATSSGTKRLRHPRLGELVFTHVVLHLADDPEQKLVTFTADPAAQQGLEALLRA